MSSPRQNQTRTRLSSSHNPIHYDIGDEAAAEERLDLLLSRTDTAYAALLRPKKEERNLLNDDSRPGDITIRGWARSRGKEKTAFDITVVSPLRQDVRAHAFHDPKVVLQRSREAKFCKYDGKLPPEVGLIPLVITTFGAWEEDAHANLKEIVSHQVRNSASDSSLLCKHFFQRLSVCLQRENGSLLFERSPLSSLHPSIDGLI